MLLRLLLLIAVALALYIVLTRKLGQDQDHGDGSRPKDVRLWVIGLGILSAIVVFIFAAEIITRL
ncbi:MAG: hypothetical protein ACO3K9_07320 [Paracoccaceae bacterium]